VKRSSVSAVKPGEQVKEPPPPVDGRPAPSARSEGASPGPTALGAGGHDCDAGHDPALASAPHRCEVDLRAEGSRSSGDDALKNLDHRVARSTIARVLKAQGIALRRTGRGRGARFRERTGEGRGG
jgi:hypothetical protein